MNSIPTNTAQNNARQLTEANARTLAEVSDRIIANVSTVIVGKPETVRVAVCVFVAGGHLLIEDVPGVGKTLLASSLGRSIGGSVGRIQFTSDMLPSDITGLSVYNQGSREFEFHPGPVFANIVLGDEINRATPKTQSALLEAMAERQVTVDGVSRALPDPFTVFATQNPNDMEGTFALPEAQRDRFMARISIGYPSAQAELQMLHAREHGDPAQTLHPVITSKGVKAVMTGIGQVHLARSMQEYIVALVAATRTDPEVALGASPRATIHLAQACRAFAAMQGRTFAVPHDAAVLAPVVLPHRLVMRDRSLMSAAAFAAAQAVVNRIVSRTPVSDTR